MLVTTGLIPQTRLNTMEDRRTPHESLGQAPVSETAPVVSPEVAVFDARTEKQREVLKKLVEGIEAILMDEGFRKYLR